MTMKLALEVKTEFSIRCYSLSNKFARQDNVLFVLVAWVVDFIVIGPLSLIKGPTRSRAGINVQV